MSLKLTSLLLLLLFIFAPFSSGMVEPLQELVNANRLIFEIDGIQVNSRKLMMLDLQDYDDTKANNKHDPKNTKPGNGRP